MIVPKTKREDVSNIIAGVEVRDPYRWLEDFDDPFVKDWIHEQNEYTFSFLHDQRYEVFSKELIKNFETVDFTSPFPVKGRYFYTERHPGEDQSVLYMKRGLEGTAISLVDPNGRRAGNTVSLDFWQPSRDGHYLAYGLSEGGNEISTLYVLDADTGNQIDVIPYCRYSSICWLKDNSGFFYSRNPVPGTVPRGEEGLHNKIFFHKLGELRESDELIFGEGRPKDDMLGISLSLDQRYLAISAARKWTENELYIYDTKEKRLSTLITGISARFRMYFLADKVLLFTNYKANNSRVLFSDINDFLKPVDEWKELIPETGYSLETVACTKDKILVEYFVDVCSEVRVFDHSGKQIDTLPLPEYSSIGGFTTNKEESEFFYSVSSFVVPKISYRFDPEVNSYSLFRKQENPINPDEYVVKQEWFVSKDGTKVPMFIFHKSDVSFAKPVPTVLYGYGGFASSMTPGFMKGWVPWTERGGVFAVANIRGGVEFGERWHIDAMKEKKQNSYDDFIAAAEHLIAQNYTDSRHLGILGGSNGGLLTCAVAVQRPELFKAVGSEVPLTDMARYPLFGIAIRWIHEYGDPQIKEELLNILKWSPYHNVREGVEYPSFFFMTGEKDSRVDPLHSRKMAAMFQYANRQNKVLLFTESDAGHGAGKPIAKIVEDQALLLTFFAEELDLGVN